MWESSWGRLCPRAALHVVAASTLAARTVWPHSNDVPDRGRVENFLFKITTPSWFWEEDSDNIVLNSLNPHRKQNNWVAKPNTHRHSPQNYAIRYLQKCLSKRRWWR